MARPFIPDPSTITSSDLPWPLKDRATDHAPVVETFTWPGVENDYTIRLDYGILEQVGATFMDTATGTELFIVRWRDNPGPGEVAVHFDRGLARVHSSRGGHGGSAGYQPLATVFDAQFLSNVQALATRPKVFTLNHFIAGTMMEAGDNVCVGVIQFPDFAGSEMPFRFIKEVLICAAESGMSSGLTTTLAFGFGPSVLSGIEFSIDVSDTSNQPIIARLSSGSLPLLLSGNWELYVFCTQAGKHGNINITLVME